MQAVDNETSKGPTMKLTWHETAGGTSAHDDLHGYVATTEIGEYHISPVGMVKRHAKFITYFTNTKGKLPGGLWHKLGQPHTQTEAKKLCQKHFEENFTVDKVAEVR